MISRLRGTLESKKPPFLLLDVNGVGYALQAPMSTIYQLPECGQMITLLTHFQVREDAQMLYGFYDERERSLFRALIKISGVGPKVALTILSGMDPSSFILCIERRDVAPLVRLPGIGQKTAERLLIEMAGKLKNTDSTEAFSAKAWEKSINPLTPASVQEEAISALIALGFKPQEASRAIAKWDPETSSVDGLSSETLIRFALQGLAKKLD
jgi:Holliday junction DNA helicase RuvA